ncbi:hydrogen peroxide-dependent heme synthase [Ornithinimicrobium cryptoxanthini]|uniref:Coproheme decarboxylase n=1 Tax=Ornithinimicrobium cryptoxanthini TaxID=2934161 RepID=A0ABY4YMI2_9MICO|nr:hydrogen peroxide-dependent heme synthase [Ornithinimicrobium cryptoxanthini]USQ77700.1 chlorite dismutase family protein [Ornithinimicrobium cryptoxanthini]
MTEQPAAEPAETPTPDADRVNSEVRYAMYSVFRTVTPLGDDRDDLTHELEMLLAAIADEGVVVRGLYDVSGLRADADFLIWWHAESVDLLQSAYQRLRRTGLGAQLEPVWSNVGLHRPAEFNRGHIPAFLAGEEPGDYLCVYPFVRSYEWYVLPEDERRRMLREHGLAARDFKDVRANTIASFALGDYEWLLAFEADELHRIVDLMRELRGVDARLHVREEIPFFTGKRVDAAALVASLA